MFDIAVESKDDVKAVLQGKPSVVLFDGNTPSSADGSRPEVKAWLAEGGQLLASGPELNTSVIGGRSLVSKLPSACRANAK